MLFKTARALFLENERLRAVITIRGSKMVSLFDKKSGREFLLQSSGDELRQGGYDSDYNAADVCGFDEMFPAIDACCYEGGPWNGVRIPDHGEVWGLDWDCDSRDGALEASVYGVRFPYKLSKRIYFKETNILRIDYSLQNLSAFEMDFIWAAHAMFALDDDSVLLLPDSRAKAVLTYSYNSRMGSYGDSFPLDSRYKAYGQGGLSVVNPGEVYMDKYYIKDKLPSGSCGIAYPSGGLACMLSFPVQTVPYLGVLLGNGLHIGNCAIVEPCTGAFDRPDRAKAFGRNSVLKAKGDLKWYLEFRTTSFGAYL